MPSQWYDNRRAIRNRIDQADDTIERWIAEERDDTNSEAPPFEPTPGELSAAGTAAVTVNAEWLAYMLEYARSTGFSSARQLQLRQEAKNAEFPLQGGTARKADKLAEDATLDPIPGVKLYRVVANGETLAGGMTWVGARSERADRYRSDPGGHFTILADVSETDGQESTLGRTALKGSVRGVNRYAVVRNTDWHPVARGLSWSDAMETQGEWSDATDSEDEYEIVVDSS